MVRLCMDGGCILKPESGDVLMKNISDYAPIYARIVAAIHAGQPLTVVVQNPTCASWLQVAQQKYGVEQIQIEIISHHSRLADLWKVTIPDWVSNQAIARSGLLDIPLQAQPNQSFENVILEAFYSPFLAYDRLPQTYLVDLLNSYDAARWTQAGQRPLVRAVFSRRLEAWVKAATSESEQLLVARLRQDPAMLVHTLAQLKVLRGYPIEVGRRILGNEYDDLVALNLDLGALPVREADLNDVVDQIRAHLATSMRTPSPAKALPMMIEQVSGQLTAEFGILQSAFKSGDVNLNADLVRQIRLKFVPIRDRLEQELADLDLLITPPRPPQPDPDGIWTADDWLLWAVEHYLPYRFWLEEIGLYDEEIASYADAYADWLYEHYAKLRLTYVRMIYRGLLASQHLLTGPAPVLVVVADNLNYKFFPDLVRYLEAQGFFGQETTSYLSMLPSCTEVSKKCLFVAQPEPFSGTAYQKPILAAWEPTLNGRRVCYLPHIGAMRSVKRRKHDVYFLNYLPIDRALHDDEQQTGISYSAAIRQHLRALAKDIRTLAERIGAEHDLNVIITSDHGSTRIAAGAPNLIDQKFYADRVTDKHHRYVTISDAKLLALPDNVRFECYILAKQRFGLPDHYLGARSTYRFVDPGEGVCVHGGLSPEETIVPLAVFSPVTVEPKPLTIRLLADEFRYDVKSIIRLELVNVNQYACQETRVSVLTPNVETELVHLGELAATSPIEAQLEARIRRAAGETASLTIRIDYTFLGHPRSQIAELPIEMKRIMTTTFDFDDL